MYNKIVIAQTMDEIARDLEELANQSELASKESETRSGPTSSEETARTGDLDEVSEKIQNLGFGADLTKGLIWCVNKVGLKVAPNVWLKMIPKLVQIATHPVFGRVLPAIILGGGGGAVAFILALAEAAFVAEMGWELGMFMYNFLEKRNPALLKKIVTSFPAKVTQEAFGISYNLLGKFINMEGSDADIQEQKKKTDLLSSNNSIAATTLFKQLIGQPPQQEDMGMYAEKYTDFLKSADEKKALSQLAALILKEKKKATPPNLEAIIQKTMQNMKKILNKQQDQQRQARCAYIAIKKAAHRIFLLKNNY